MADVHTKEIRSYNNEIFEGLEDFQFPKLPEPTKVFKDILEPESDLKYTLTDHLWKYLGVPLRVGLSATSPAQKPMHKAFTGLSASIPHAIPAVA